MQVSHTARALSASFDDPNLVSAAGLVPAMAVKTGLGSLADQWVKLPEYFGANAGLKVTALVAGMLAGPTRSIYADIEIMPMKVAFAREIAVLAGFWDGSPCCASVGR